MSPHILALDVAGAPHRWINVRDAAHYYATDMSQGKDFIVRHFDHVPTLTKDMLLVRDRYICAYCAQRFRYDQLDRACPRVRVCI